MEKARQDKFFIDERCVEKLEAAFNGQGDVPSCSELTAARKSDLPLHQKDKMPAFSDLVATGEVIATTPLERKDQSLLQVSFVLTRGEDEIMLVSRNKDNHSVTSGNSVMISTKPSPDNPPKSDVDLMTLFKQKIKNEALVSRVDSLRFLGVVRNTRNLPGVPGAYAHYYFYVFELRYAKKKSTELEEMKKHVVKNVPQESLDPLLGWRTLDAELANEVDVSVCAGDWAALHLLAMHRNVPSFAMVNTPAVFRPSGDCVLYSKYSQSYFVSYAKNDWKALVWPLCQVLKKMEVPIWTQHKKAKCGFSWEIANANVLWYVKGIIVIETPKSFRNDNVAKEVAAAIRIYRRRFGNFKIIRVAPEQCEKKDYDLFCRKVSHYLKTYTSDGAFRADDIEIYRNATWFLYQDPGEISDILRETCVEEMGDSAEN